MHYPATDSLVKVHSIMNHVDAVVRLHHKSVLNTDYESACVNLMDEMINWGDQLTNALAVSVLLENGVSFSTFSKCTSPDKFKAFSRSIRPILQCAVEVENMEQQMQRINMFRDLFMTEAI